MDIVGSRGVFRDKISVNFKHNGRFYIFFVFFLDYLIWVIEKRKLYINFAENKLSFHEKTIGHLGRMPDSIDRHGAVGRFFQ